MQRLSKSEKEALVRKIEEAKRMCYSDKLVSKAVCDTMGDTGNCAGCAVYHLAVCGATIAEIDYLDINAECCVNWNELVRIAKQGD